MSRKRIFIPGLSVHVIHRGNNGISIFHDDVDRLLFLHYMRHAAVASGVCVHGFSLMSTHCHALVTPSDKLALPAAMKTIGERYVRFFNRKYGRFGTLWGGSYRALPVADDLYWLTCLRYIEQNPVRAKMVSSPEDYRWSSYRPHALGERAEWLSSHPAYEALGRTATDRQRNYRAMCSVLLTDGELAIQRHPTPLSSIDTNVAETAIGI
jgi:putative transposase